jgi:branched-chain amino acid transport system substrate-binding protein
MRRARFLVSGLVVSLIAVACSDDDAPSPTSGTSPDATTSTSAAPTSDGRLTIGLLLPQGANSIGDPMIAAARQAREDITRGGGDVTLVEAAEGRDASEAAAGIALLLARGVDAIVGPSSSTTTLGTLGELVDAGVLTCSPTASSLLLDDFPDDGLFFRSIASDSLQARAIARLSERTGGRKVAIAYLDDIYGRGLLDATREALTAATIDDVSEIPMSPDDESLADQAEAAVESAPDVVIVLADNVEGPRMLAALDDALVGTRSAELPDVVVNDAIRRPESPEATRGLRTEFRERIEGVSPVATPPEEPVQTPSGSDIELNGNFSVNAYNCLTAIALAARSADSDLPADIAGEMLAVSTLGSPCSNYEACALVIDAGDNVDFQGPDGYFDLDADGNISRARFDVFEFDETGVDTSAYLLSYP